MAFIRSVLAWLGLERPRGRVGLRPHRVVDIDLRLAAAHAACLDAVDRVLGATVYVDDRKTGYIEAGFGLVNSERLHVSLEPVRDARTRVRIEAVYPATVAAPEISLAVDALARALQDVGTAAT